MKKMLKTQFQAEKDDPTVEHSFVGKSLKQILDEGLKVCDWNKLCRGKLKELTGLTEWQACLFYE